MERCAAVALCWMILGGVVGAQGPQPDRIAAEVARRVGRGERVRVVMELASIAVPGESLDSRRRGLRQTQDRVLIHLRAGERARRLTHLPIVAVEIDPDELAILSGLPDVRNIRIDELRKPDLTQSVPLIGAPTAWSIGGSGTGWAVAVLDTGIEKTHPFLANKVIAEACFSTTSSSASSLCPGSVDGAGPGTGRNCAASIQGCEHGTHVAGIVAGAGAGFSGVARTAALISVQVFSRVNDASFCYPGASPCVGAYDSDVLAALDWVYGTRTTYDIASVNMSLGGGSFGSACDATYPAYKSTIDLLRGAGIATVVAAGNGGNPKRISAPACISSAVSVGATTKSDQIASYSNRSPQLSLLAPGSSIYSSVPSGRYATLSGTSMAAPHAAGAWAVMKSRNPSASVATILTTLQSTALRITDGATATSRPRIRLDAAVRQLPAGPLLFTRLTSNLAFPQPANVPITWTARAVGGIGAVEYKFLVYSSQTATWTVFRDYSTSPSAAWTAVTTGTYTVQVWARHVGSKAASEAVKSSGSLSIIFVPVSITSISADHVSPLMAGVVTTWTVRVRGGSGPLEYRFLRYDIGQGTWTVAREYTLANTYSWAPGPLDRGTFRFQVWVRTSGAAQPYEAFANSASFSLLGPTNFLLNSQTGDYIGLGQRLLGSGEGATTSLVWQDGKGWRVGFNAVGANLNYYFWYFAFAPPSGQDLQPGAYEHATEFPVEAASDPGLLVYGDGRGCSHVKGRFAVLEAYNLGQPDATFAADFEQHCEGMTPALFGSVRFNSGIPPSEFPARVTLTSTATGLVPLGTPLTFTATGSGGAAPLSYQFRRYAKSTNTWTILQDGPSGTLAWTPTSADDYVIVAGVRSKGSSAPYEASASTSFRAFMPPIVVTLTRSPTGALTRGTQYTWKAASTGGYGPVEYQWHVWDSNAGGWGGTQYSSDNTLVWTASVPGTYIIQVWVRRVGVTAAYEAWTSSGQLVVP